MRDDDFTRPDLDGQRAKRRHADGFPSIDTFAPGSVFTWSRPFGSVTV